MGFAFVTCSASLDHLRQDRPLCRIVPDFFLQGPNRLLPLSDSKLHGSREGRVLQLPLLSDRVSHISGVYFVRRVQQLVQRLRAANINMLGIDPQLDILRPLLAGNDLILPTGVTLATAAVLVTLRHLCSRIPNLRALVINPVRPPGAACARYLAPWVRTLLLAGNHLPPLERLAHKIIHESGTAAVVIQRDAAVSMDADIIIDLAGMDMAAAFGATVIWQPFGGSAPAHSTVFSELVYLLPGLGYVPGNLPPDTLLAPMAESVLLFPNRRLAWASTAREVTVEGIGFAAFQACQEGLKIAGFMHRNEFSSFSETILFDKI